MKRINFGYIIILLAFLCATNVFAQSPGERSFISIKNGKGYFPLAINGRCVPLHIADSAYAGVLIAAKSLQADMGKVTTQVPALLKGRISNNSYIVLIGTLGKDRWIDKLISDKKINADSIRGKWEAHLTQVINDPMPGVKKALVIVGSDKRGTIYGIYELSAQIGVSPWYWWADVPVKKQKTIYITHGHIDTGPAVKYRGIFINDEAPSFSGWAKEKFGGIDHKVYTRLFDLILRLKGNYLWPAMWDNAFNDDDKLDPVLADEYGVVMGTSHHEPMNRAQQEWKRYGKGAWNYETNDTVLRAFWRKGIANMGNKETIVNIGMRGDGDMPMTEGSNIALLERIVHDQRDIIADVTKKDTSATPQMWALYKEVQDYYDKGMRVPNDVTLLLCDDNWGNIRKLPDPNAPIRKGGYGIYYHFDYVGGPRNYKWLNTNPISQTWEQMHMAYAYGANRVWIVNVGDLKPMELPITFFLDYAWSPDKWPANKLNTYTITWAAQQFGSKYAEQIANILNLYTKYNARRKPELLDENTYSLVNYREFETVVNSYDDLDATASELYRHVPAEYKDAYYQLVLYPVEACANLNRLYYLVAKNKLYAAQGRATTNELALKVKGLFKKDSLLSVYYNKVMANGKWDHMMDQTHIGYTGWQQPPVNSMPAVKIIKIPEKAAMGIMVEGSELDWSAERGEAVLPGLYPGCGGHYFEIFNKGRQSFNYKINCDLPCMSITNKAGTINAEQRIWVNVDWKKAPAGVSRMPINICSTNGETVTINAEINNNLPIKSKGFFENNGYVSMEAGHFTKAVNSAGISWLVIPGYGRTLSGVTQQPVTAAIQEPGAGSPHLEYNFMMADTGYVNVVAYISPGLYFNNRNKLKYAVSIDNEKPQIISINADSSDAAWQKNVSDNINTTTSRHYLNSPGKHILKYWMVGPGVVLQKAVIYASPAKTSYLGPPESYLVK